MAIKLELPRQAYRALTASFNEDALKGAMLIDNNYGYGTVSEYIAHIDYIMPGREGYTRLLLTSEELRGGFNSQELSPLEQVMDKKIVIYKEIFSRLGEHFSENAKSRYTEWGTYYALGGLFINEATAQLVYRTIAKKREERAHNNDIRVRNTHTFTIKGLDFKGFKRGTNTITVYLYKDFFDGKYRKYFNIKNSITDKEVCGASFKALLQGESIDGLIK